MTPILKEEIILKRVSGYMLPGHAYYIMGASGSGKTTFLNALSGRIRRDKLSRLSGECTLNDSVPLNSETFGLFGAYVMQDDILYEHFTVREALEFAARIKLTVNSDILKERVQAIINDLGLSEC